jgi:hypothetical protein
MRNQTLSVMQDLEAARVLLHDSRKDYRLASVTVLHVGLPAENCASDRTIAGREAHSLSLSVWKLPQRTITAG